MVVYSCSPQAVNLVNVEEAYSRIQMSSKLNEAQNASVGACVGAVEVLCLQVGDE